MLEKCMHSPIDGFAILNRILLRNDHLYKSIFAGTCGNILSGLKVKPSKLLTWQQLLILEKSMHAHSVYVTGGKIWLTSSPRQV